MLSLLVHSDVPKYTVIDTVTPQYHVRTLFHLTVISNYNLVVRWPKIAEHKEFGSELFQMPKQRVFCVHILLVNSQRHYSPLLNSKVILLVEMQIWKNPIDRIQKF
jgi:hypothetical protein